MSTDYERVLLVKPEVFIYRIPPLGTSRGYKAADWKLDNPDYVGRLRLVCKSNLLELKIEDKSTGELFAKCPVDKYPGPAIEAVTDSSRYFVFKIVDDSGRSAFIGAGFADRSDSFDLNVALQDHFKHAEKDEKLNIELAKEADKPKLDLGFKEGQTITINLGKRSGNATSRPKSSTNTGGMFNLPPPPAAGSRITLTNPTRASPTSALASSTNQKSDINPFTASDNGTACSSNPFTTGSSFNAAAASSQFNLSKNQENSVGNLLDL